MIKSVFDGICNNVTRKVMNSFSLKIRHSSKIYQLSEEMSPVELAPPVGTS